MKTSLAIIAAVFILLLANSSDSQQANCRYLGGYPWKPGGCLVPTDLNAAISGRNPIITYISPAHNWISGFTNGVPNSKQPSFSDLAGALSGNQLPLPSSSSPGVAFAGTAPANQFFYYLDSTGHFQSRRPNFLDLTGVASPSQIPNPTVNTYGGVKAFTAPTHEFLTGIGTDGVPLSAQPNINDFFGTLGFPDIAGQIAASQLIPPTASNLGAVKADSATGNNVMKGIDTNGAPIMGAIPVATATLLGGVKTKASENHKFLNSIGADGAPTNAQPTCGDVSDAANSCHIDATDAANITSGTLDQARLPTRSSINDIKTLNRNITTTNADGLMAGMNTQITPASSGRLTIRVVSTLFNNSSNDAYAMLRYGTGTPPSNGDAGTVGTACTGWVDAGATAAASGVPLNLECEVTGLTVSTAVWIDVALKSTTGGTVSLITPTASGHEW